MGDNAEQNIIQLVRTHRVYRDANGGDEGHRTHRKVGASASKAVAAGDEDQIDNRSRFSNRNPNTQDEARIVTIIIITSQNKMQLVWTHAKDQERFSKDTDGGDEGHRTHRKVGAGASKAIANGDEDQIDNVNRSRTGADDVAV